MERNRMKWIGAAVAAAMPLVFAASPARAMIEDDADASGIKTALTTQSTIAAAVRPRLVVVEYHLRYDKGEAPQFSDIAGARLARAATRLERLVDEERPLEIAGVLTSADGVVTGDTFIHPRFIESIKVRVGDEVLDATVAAVGSDKPAVMLKLSKAPASAPKLAAFDAAKTGALYAVSLAEQNGAWATFVRPISPAVVVEDGGRKVMGGSPGTLVVTADGTPVGLIATTQIPADDSWRGSPAAWSWTSAADLGGLIARTEATTNTSLPRVQLSFRSPKKTAQGPGMGGADTTEQNVVGVALEGNRVLVLANLRPETTARLERILIHVPGGEPIAAKFAFSLKDFGGFVATAEKPLKAVALSDKAPTALRNLLLLAADVNQQGETRTAYYHRATLDTFERRWDRKVYPDAFSSNGGDFLFATDGSLAVAPLIRRPRLSLNNSARMRGDSYTMVPAAYLRDMLAGGEKFADATNVPLTEENEVRLGWLGVELQPLSSELARVKNLSGLTQDGRFGGIVAYVYPGSPADKAGIKEGNVVLRIFVPGQAEPVNVTADAYMFADRPYPWDRWDELPEQFFDQIPPPWPTANNALNRLLNEVGIGKAFKAEVFTDAGVVSKDFTVTQSPTHYDNAPRAKDEKLGLTVRDMTYEVRKFFLRKEADPGVVISMVEPGSVASQKGIKPMELVVAVNGTAVNNATQFAELVKGKTEVSIEVRRFNKNRTVKLTIAAGDAPATKPAAGEQR